MLGKFRILVIADLPYPIFKIPVHVLLQIETQFEFTCWPISFERRSPGASISRPMSAKLHDKYQTHTSHISRNTKLPQGPTVFQHILLQER